MGAWGYGNFENDDALDWLYELGDAGDLSVVHQTVSTAAQPDIELDAYLSCRILAAAEIIAALLGRPAADITQEARAWATKPLEVPKDLIQTALQAVYKVETQSELRELWQEAGAMPAWQPVIDGLKDRLAHP